MSQLVLVPMPLLDCMEVGVIVGWWCMSWEATYVAVISNRAQLCTETSEGIQDIMFVSRGDRDLGVAFLMHAGSQSLSRGEAKDSTLLSSYDGDLSLPLGLALGSPIFPSGCEGKLGVALESLQGLRDLT